jgi:hypothetical protein
LWSWGKTKKAPSLPGASVYHLLLVLRLGDCLGRARRGACAAVGAFGRVDDENGVALAYRFARAFRHAGSAGKACIGDFVGHGNPPYMFFVFEKSGKTHFSPKKPFGNIHHYTRFSTVIFCAAGFCCFCHDYLNILYLLRSLQLKKRVMVSRACPEPAEGNHDRRSFVLRQAQNAQDDAGHIFL